MWESPIVAGVVLALVIFLIFLLIRGSMIVRWIVVAIVAGGAFILHDRARDKKQLAENKALATKEVVQGAQLAPIFAPSPAIQPMYTLAAPNTTPYIVSPATQAAVAQPQMFIATAPAAIGAGSRAETLVPLRDPVPQVQPAIPRRA